MQQINNKPKGRRWVRWLKRIVVTVIILVIVLVFGVLPYLLSFAVTDAGTRPDDRKLTDTPSSKYGVHYQNIEFPAMDGVNLSGWYMPSTGKGVTIIYSHGLFRSRREMLGRAVDLYKLGYGALLYDSRNHGTSGHAKTGLGYFERKDVEGAIRYLRDTAHSNDRIVLMGVSMGAVADLLAAAETPEVSAVISDSSFLSFDDTVKHHLRLFFHMPPFPLAYEMEFLIERRAGFDGSELSPLRAVKKIGDRPILFIAGAHDPRMPPSVAEQLRNASSSPLSQLLVVDGPESNRHGHSYFVNPELYVDTVSRFIDSTAAAELAPRMSQR